MRATRLANFTHYFVFLILIVDACKLSKFFFLELFLPPYHFFPRKFKYSPHQPSLKYVQYTKIM